MDTLWKTSLMIIDIIASSSGFIGTLLLTFSGLPVSDIMGDGTRIIQTDADDKSKKKARNMRIISKTGIGFICLAFFFS